MKKKAKKSAGTKKKTTAKTTAKKGTVKVKSKPAASGKKKGVTPLFEGKMAPGFALQSTSGETLKLEDFSGKKLVLYFYPKDMTPGCTVQAQDFSSSYEEFQRVNADVIGVSRDKMSLHDRFREKYNIPFALLSDEAEKAVKAYKVLKMKNMYGRLVQGIERSTFVIDEKGVVLKEWRAVKVPGHVQEVLDFLKQNGG